MYGRSDKVVPPYKYLHMRAQLTYFYSFFNNNALSEDIPTSVFRAAVTTKRAYCIKAYIFIDIQKSVQENFVLIPFFVKVLTYLVNAEWV